VTTVTAATEIDPGLVFLQRAAARLMLVETGEIEIGEAIVGLIEPFEELFDARLCDCVMDIVKDWERRYPRRKPRAGPRG
jgi:hypothetical protein